MIDSIDRTIISILQKDARTSHAELARRTGIAPSAILARIRKMEESGLIRGYEARLDPKRLGASLVAFVFVHAEERVGGVDTGRQIGRIPEVQEVHQIAGEDCYLVKVRVADTEALGRLLRESIGSLPSVRSTRTTIVLSSVKETALLALPADPGARGVGGRARRRGPARPKER
ncbi:MAG TPA: Lrp/AsnC family transcriptional regulator [Candidatus Eisenbacteria bacterium]